VLVQELRPRLWRWTGLHPDWTPDEGGPEGWEPEVGCVYYEAPDTVVLIDPLVPPEDEERFWAALDRDVERAGVPVHVLLTVFWHSRSSRAIADRYGAEIWAHENVLQEEQTAAAAAAGGVHMQAACEVEPTRTFAFGETLPGGVEPRYAVRFDEAIMWIPKHRALVFGDVMLGSPLRLCPEGWLRESTHADLKEALRPLLELTVELVLPSHGAPVTADGGAALARILER
jgi:glyoxylase-like metal-dependent hydrolase (beta-lactamase superfamily II)